MSTLPKIDEENLRTVFLSPFIAKLASEVIQQQELLKATHDIYKTYHQRIHRVDSNNVVSKYINETEWLKSTLYDLLDEEFPEKKAITFEEEFDAFCESADDFIAKLPKDIVLIQKEERFAPKAGDRFGLRLNKRLKNAAFHTLKTPQKIANWFRKEKKPIQRWTHRVPLRLMMRHFFVNRFVQVGLPYFRELQALKCSALNLKWSIVREINVEVSQMLDKNGEGVDELLKHIDSIAERKNIAEKIETLDEKLTQWQQSLQAELKKIHADFISAIEIVDTVELTINEFEESRIEDGKKNYQAEFLRLFNGWRNTLFAQLDDFQVDLELYHIKYSSLLQFSLLNQSCRLRIKKTIDENIEVICNTFDELAEMVNEQAKSDEDIGTLLKKRRVAIKSKLESRIIPEAIEAIYGQNIPYLLDRLEYKIKEQIDRMKDVRIIYSNSDYNAPIKKSELSHFNPKELVMIDIFAKFSEKNKKLKGAVVRQLEHLQLNLKELSGIVDYNLESAISSLGDEEKQESIREIALEGIDRTKNKVREIETELDKLRELINTQLKTSIQEMSKRLIDLTVNENILNLRMQLAKARAIEKTKFYRKNIIKTIRRFGPLSWRFLRAKYFKVAELVNRFLEYIGLKERENTLSAELSDFLNQAEEAIEKLPYVYRRLYRIQPLEEEVFFEGRTNELKQLNTAYENWKEGNFSSSSLIGEKGSGASSLVNFFVKDLNLDKILRYKLNKSYSSKEDFILFFQDLLKTEHIHTFEDIVDYLNNGKEEIIILEDVQHFYLKKIHGFDALNLLFELISLTARKIFWVIEVTTYTWSYLQKTINIEGYFKYNIHLSKLDEEKIIQLIMKRHRVSGYNLRFESANLSKSESRKLNRMSEEEQQEYLQKDFFSNLNKFAQSNISLALLYWMRSTHEVTNNTIVIAKIEQMRYNFLSSLGETDIFTLHALLIHDSLSTQEHAALFHQSDKQSKMTLMVLEDNGILKNEDGRFKVNRLLYRQVVNVLRNKNIIH